MKVEKVQIFYVNIAKNRKWGPKTRPNHILSSRFSVSSKIWKKCKVKCCQTYIQTHVFCLFCCFEKLKMQTSKCGFQPTYSQACILEFAYFKKQMWPVTLTLLFFFELAFPPAFLHKCMLPRRKIGELCLIFLFFFFLWPKHMHFTYFLKFFNQPILVLTINIIWSSF